MRRLVPISALVALAAAATSLAAGAAAPEPSVVVGQPTVTCTPDGNAPTVHTSVTANIDLDGMSMVVGRWEEMATPPSHWTEQFETVEWFSADFYSQGVAARTSGRVLPSTP